MLLAMEAIDAIMVRRSIRKYQPKPLPEEDLRKILEAGRQAPSAGNRQPWHFIVVEDPQEKRALAEACSGQTWMAEAGAIIAGVGHRPRLRHLLGRSLRPRARGESARPPRGPSGGRPHPGGSAGRAAGGAASPALLRVRLPGPLRTEAELKP